MKRFIRTKDGKIIDLQAVNHSIRHAKIRKINNGDIKVEKQADTIEELIELGDLVSVNWTDCENAKYPRKVVGVGDNYINVDNDFYEDEKYEDHTNYITELYTKQCDNYILVAREENGEWRVI